jgi:drug/metabolite transporter (DMT)-like permease
MSLIYLSILFVIIGQFLNASIVLIDKYIVTKTPVSNPGVYAFYVSIISGAVLFMVPFGVVSLPSTYTVWMSLLLGYIFISSIILLFTSLKKAHATDVVAWLTVVSTVTVFILSFFFLHEELPRNFIFALPLLLLGMIFVGHFRFHAESFLLLLLSGFLFGLSAVLLKTLFLQASFVDGFFWSRLGNAFAGLSLLLIPAVRKNIFKTSKEVSHKHSFLIFTNRVLGGVAFLSILYAIHLGSVSVVNALGSLQFVFIFLLIFLLKKKMSHQYEHEFRPGHVFHKVLSVLFIAAGFIVLFS